MLSACRGLFDSCKAPNFVWLSLSVNIQLLFETPEKWLVKTVKECIQTRQAPEAIGPYSQAIKTGEFIFVSGQISIDPSTGQFVEGGVAQQTEQVIRNLSAVLEAAGSGLGDVVKTTVFLVDMQDFGLMNDVYARFFTDQPPARATVAAARLPRDARVEIEAIAIVRDKTPTGRG